MYNSETLEFVKLWDLAPFSNWASLEKGPCQKSPLNCNSQQKYKGWKPDTAPYKSLQSWAGSKLKEPEQILKGLYGMLSNSDPPHLHREPQFRANFGYVGII